MPLKGVIKVDLVLFLTALSVFHNDAIVQDHFDKWVDELVQNLVYEPRVY